MKVLIRKIKHSDYIEIINLYNEAFEKNIMYHDIDVGKNEDIIVAEIESGVVGTLTIDYLMDRMQGKNYAIINNVCVKKEFLKTGIGTKLMENAIKLCQERGCSYIKLTSNTSREAAHALYKKLGFKIIDTCVFKKELEH